MQYCLKHFIHIRELVSNSHLWTTFLQLQNATNSFATQLSSAFHGLKSAMVSRIAKIYPMRVVSAWNLVRVIMVVAHKYARSLRRVRNAYVKKDTGKNTFVKTVSDNTYVFSFSHSTVEKINYKYTISKINFIYIYAILFSSRDK